MSAPGTVAKLGLWSVVLPAAGFLLGQLLLAIIPECKCDGGAGCNTCGGVGDLVAFLVFGGASGALLSAVAILPACLLVAVVVGMFTKENPAEAPALELSLYDISTVAALKKFREGRPITETCMTCGTVLAVKALESGQGSSSVALRVKCKCGRSNGTFQFQERRA